MLYCVVNDVVVFVRFGGFTLYGTVGFLQRAPDAHSMCRHEFHLTRGRANETERECD